MTSSANSLFIRPRVFFDVTIHGEPAGRIVIELFSDIVPKTVENFRLLCTGEKGLSPHSGVPLFYRGSIFHRIVRGFMLQGGDFTRRNGTGGESIYGPTFADENFTVKHDQPYLLSMANRGPNTNTSQFFITTRPCPHLNGKHVAFGRVVMGQEVVDQMEQVPVNQEDRPFQELRIDRCGELELRVPLDRIVAETKAEPEKVRDQKKKKKKKHKSSKHERRRHRSRDEKSPGGEDERRSPSRQRPRGGRSQSPPREQRQPSVKQLEQDSLKQASAGQEDVRPENAFKEEVSITGRRYKGRGFMRYRTPPHERERSRRSPSRSRQHHE